jgi:hypothetical protein
MIMQVYGGTLLLHLKRVELQLESEIEELKVNRIDAGKSTAMVLSQLDGVTKLRRVKEFIHLVSNYFDHSYNTKFFLEDDDLWILIPRERLTHQFKHNES